MQGKTYRVMGRMYLDGALALLPRDDFLRVHRLLVVNLRHVVAIKGAWVTMANEETLPIGKKYADALYKAFTERYLNKD